MTNSGAFGFKASYASNGYYYNETAFPQHLTAFRNAFNQVNGITGINIRQTSNFNWLGMHEVGHALGMHHQRPGIYSVMRTGSRISMNSLGVIDRDNLNWRY